jgi:hypothetical protein
MQKEKSTEKIDLWIKIVPIVLAAVGLFFTIYKGCKVDTTNSLEQDSWRATRVAYNKMTTLTGEIIKAHASKNDTALQRLFYEFNGVRVADLKAVNESKRVNDQMTNLYSKLDDAIHHVEDVYNSNALEDACRQLEDSIRVSINEGDAKYGKPN